MQSADDVATAMESWSYIAVRFTTFVSIVVVVGAVLFLWMIVPRLARAGHDALVAELRARVRLLGLGGSVALLALAVARLALQRAVLTEAFGGAPVAIGDVLSGAWGIGMALQCAGAVAGVLAFGPSLGGAASRVAGFAALLVAGAPALSGHAAGEESPALPILADVVHVLAAGTWAGMLTALVVVALPILRRRGDAEVRTHIPPLLGAFSPLALTSALLLAVTGTYAAWLHLPAIDALWTTRYGEVLFRKLVLVAVMVLVGAVNWRRFGPAASAPAGAARLTRSGWFELTIAAAILFATAVLVARGTPTDLLE